MPFQAGSLAVDDTGHLESLLSQYQAAASADDGVVVGTQLPQVLAAAANDEHTSTSIVLVMTSNYCSSPSSRSISSLRALQQSGYPMCSSQCYADSAPVARSSSLYSSPLSSSSPLCPWACS